MAQLFDSVEGKQLNSRRFCLMHTTSGTRSPEEVGRPEDCHQGSPQGHATRRMLAPDDLPPSTTEATTTTSGSGSRALKKKRIMMIGPWFYRFSKTRMATLQRYEISKFYDRDLEDPIIMDHKISMDASRLYSIRGNI